MKTCVRFWPVTVPPFSRRALASLVLKEWTAPRAPGTAWGFSKQDAVEGWLGGTPASPAEKSGESWGMTASVYFLSLATCGPFGSISQRVAFK